MCAKTYFPENYQPILDLKQTEQAILQVKDFFQINLSTALRLYRVTAPLFVKKGTGINDNLNGIEKPVEFKIKNMNGMQAEIVQSLAKWKRLMLADLGIRPGYGLYTDMNAIRPDEELDNIHSLYVDQWDWELIISNEERIIDFLKKIVENIYQVLKRTEFFVFDNYPAIEPCLPDEITFIHTEELLSLYPGLTPQEREDKIAEKYKAVFLIGIGGELSNGQPHDKRAPDYDDWTSETGNGYKGLNGDIIVWNQVLKSAFEISSMGIRVDKAALLHQLKITNTQERKALYFHQRLLKGELPLSIGGGIGQSRLCMFFLRKAHIGEIQSSLWPEGVREECLNHNIMLL